MDWRIIIKGLTSLQMYIYNIYTFEKWSCSRQNSGSSETYITVTSSFNIFGRINAFIFHSTGWSWNFESKRGPLETYITVTSSFNILENISKHNCSGILYSSSCLFLLLAFPLLGPLWAVLMCLLPSIIPQSL